MELVILADDFTGASDSAAPFGVGREVLLVLSATVSPWLWDRGGVDVLAVDLDLRECPDPVAQAKTEGVARQLGSTFPDARVFLKIDSTLRGPIAGLVAGALAGSGKDVAVIAPAFPEQGRFLHDGRVVVNGEAGTSLPVLLGSLGTALVGAEFAGSAEQVAQAVEHARVLGARRVVVDADSSECLRSVAAAWRQHEDWLLVGSGGLSRQVARSGVSGQVPELPGVTGVVLVIAGSPTSVTAAQIEHLRGIGTIVSLRAEAPPPRLPASARAVLVLCTPTTSERDAGQSAQAIADTVAEWSGSVLPEAVVLAGGATARKVCERLGAAGVRFLGELSPGVPVGRLVGGVWDRVLVVTKAGGFGKPTTLLDVVRSVGVLSTEP